MAEIRRAYGLGPSFNTDNPANWQTESGKIEAVRRELNKIANERDYLKPINIDNLPVSDLFNVEVPTDLATRIQVKYKRSNVEHSGLIHLKKAVKDGKTVYTATALENSNSGSDSKVYSNYEVLPDGAAEFHTHVLPEFYGHTDLGDFDTAIDGPTFEGSKNLRLFFIISVGREGFLGRKSKMKINAICHDLSDPRLDLDNYFGFKRVVVDIV